MAKTKRYEFDKGRKYDMSNETRNRGETVFDFKSGSGKYGAKRTPSRFKGGKKSTTGFNRQALKGGKVVTVRKLKQLWY